MPVDVALNETHRLVVRYNCTTAESTLWLDPLTESDPSVTATDGAGPIDVTSFALRQGYGMGALVLDDLKVGTSFSAVVPAQPVPMEIALDGEEIVISWPAVAGYVLEVTESLSPPDWQPEPTQPSPENGRLVVRLSIEGGTRYYRLIQPQ